MEVSKNAPVVAASEIDVAASPDVVWEVLTEFQRWPSWNPDVKSMSFTGDVGEGAVFRWRAGPGTISSTIRRVDRPRLIGWTGRTFGIDAVHVYRLEPRDGGTHVTTEESYEGLVARLFRGRLRAMLQTALDAGLERLKREAESRSS